MNQETEEVLERARQAAARAGKAADRRARVRGDREDIARKLEKVRAEERHLQEQAEAEALVTDGGTAIAAEVRPRLQRLQGTRDELETRLDQAEKEHRQAQEEKHEAALQAVRALRRELEEALDDLRDALEAVAEEGGPVAARYVAFCTARDRVADLDRRIRHWAGQANATVAQRGRLKRFLKSWGRNLSGAALVGWSLVETMDWLARFDGPVGEHLATHGVELAEGSPRLARPFAAQEEVVAALEQGRLPGGTTALT